MPDNQENLSIIIHVHSPVNPPGIGHASNAKIKPVNFKYFSIENWQDDLSKRTLKITDPKTLGLLNFQDFEIERFAECLILSCNLVLKRVAFSKITIDSTRSVMEREKELPPKPKTVDTTPGKEIIITDILQATDHLGTAVLDNDELDEDKVLELLSKILSIKNNNAQSTLNIIDMQKSLDQYQFAMNSFDKVGIFMHLFASLELSTNCDGKKRCAQELDQEVARISGIDDSVINNCRQFNNRVKHKNKNSRQNKEYAEELNKLTSKIINVREIAQKIITFRLNSIVCPFSR